MKKVYIAKNPADAHLLKGLLAGENIEAEVRGEFLYGVRGEVPITPDTCPSVWVTDDVDYDQAMELMAPLPIYLRARSLTRALDIRGNDYVMKTES